jgi:hypothetical protein
MAAATMGRVVIVIGVGVGVGFREFLGWRRLVARPVECGLGLLSKFKRLFINYVLLNNFLLTQIDMII